MRIVVEGSGKWALQYLEALKSHVGKDDGVFFTSDSTFGLDHDAEHMPAELFSSYLQATLRSAQTIRDAGFATIDVKDTVFKDRDNPRRDCFPHEVDAVFVLTPDRTHCNVADYWLGRAGRIFVEKPFDVSAARIGRFCKGLNVQNHSKAFAVDHYFVRCNQAAADADYFAKHLLIPPRPGASISTSPGSSSA